MGFIYTLVAAVDGEVAPPNLIEFLQHNASGSIATVCLIVAVRYLIEERQRDQKRKDEQIATVKKELNEAWKIVVDEYKERTKQLGERNSYLEEKLLALMQEGKETANVKLQQQLRQHRKPAKAVSDTTLRKELRLSDGGPA